MEMLLSVLRDIRWLFGGQKNSLSGKIRQRITRGKSGKIFFAKDFSDIGNGELINKTLFRLEKNKTLKKKNGLKMRRF